MNNNRIATHEFSNADSSTLYRKQWPDEPDVQQQHQRGSQCGGCSYFAPLNFDWGICCQANSRHHLETVFEHFTCPSFTQEGWGPHSFSHSTRCECGGVEIRSGSSE